MAVVVDTNVIVAGAFKPSSKSGRIVVAIRKGRLRMIWNDDTRREIEYIVRKIPPLKSHRIDDLFRPENRFTGPTDPDAFAMVPDPADRKFAALAAAAGAVLITQDEHLLGVRQEIGVKVVTPGEVDHPDV